jgi:hypothetical protein
MNSKRCGKKRLRPNLRYWFGICPERKENHATCQSGQLRLVQPTCRSECKAKCHPLHREARRALLVVHRKGAFPHLNRFRSSSQQQLGYVSVFGRSDGTPRLEQQLDPGRSDGTPRLEQQLDPRAFFRSVLLEREARGAWSTSTVAVSCLRSVTVPTTNLMLRLSVIYLTTLSITKTA